MGGTKMGSGKQQNQLLTCRINIFAILLNFSV